MESTAAHLEKMGAATERLMDSFIDNKGINLLVDGLTNATNLLANFIESIGGGGNALMMLGSIGTQVFSNQIASGIGVSIRNLEKTKLAANEAQSAIEALSVITNTPVVKDDPVVKEITSMVQRLQKNMASMGQEQINEAMELIQKLEELLDKQVQAAQEMKKAQEEIASLGNLGGLSKRDKEGLEDPNQANAMASDILDKANVLQFGSDIVEGGTEIFEEPLIGIEKIIEEVEEAIQKHEEVYRATNFEGKGKAITNTIDTIRDKMSQLVKEANILDKTFGNSFKPEDRKRLQEMSKTLEDALADPKKYTFTLTNKNTKKELRRFNKDIVNDIYKPLEKTTQDTVKSITDKAQHACDVTAEAATESYQKAEQENTKSVEKIKNNFGSLMDTEEKVIDTKK